MPPKEEAGRLIGSGCELRRIQEQTLLATVRRNAECGYGRRYGFAEVRSADDFRRRVPLVEYAELSGAVDRMAAGDQDLLTSERVVAFFKTSGSSSRPRLIPVTRSLMLEKGRAFGIFWHLVYRDHPTLEGGRWIANFGDYVENERTAGGLKVLSETSFWNQRMQGFQPRDRWPIPPALRTVAEADLRYFAAARFALQGRLHGIMSLNPSTLHVFARTLDEHYEALVAGLGCGDLGYPGEVPDDVQRRLGPYLESAPERARELRRSVRGLASPGELQRRLPWRQLWPDLELVICWQSQGVRPYLRLLRTAVRSTALRDYITQASECIVAIPTRDGVSGGILAATSHFFEFIPQSQLDADQPTTLLADELCEGEVYELAVTTGGGLYRYRLGDCLRVMGFERGVPWVEFLYRKGSTSSMTGEKLTESQVLGAAFVAARASGLLPECVLCFPRSKPLPHYGVLLCPPPEVAALAAEARRELTSRWLSAFEIELRRGNLEYASKRVSGRLGAPQGIEMAAAEVMRLRRRLTAERGISEEQLKLGSLHRWLDVDRDLAVLQVIDGSAERCPRPPKGRAVGSVSASEGDRCG